MIRRSSPQILLLIGLHVLSTLGCSHLSHPQHREKALNDRNDVACVRLHLVDSQPSMAGRFVGWPDLVEPHVGFLIQRDRFGSITIPFVETLVDTGPHERFEEYPMSPSTPLDWGEQLRVHYQKGSEIGVVCSANRYTPFPTSSYLVERLSGKTRYHVRWIDPLTSEPEHTVQVEPFSSDEIVSHKWVQGMFTYPAVGRADWSNSVLMSIHGLEPSSTETRYIVIENSGFKIARGFRMPTGSTGSWENSLAFQGTSSLAHFAVFHDDLRRGLELHCVERGTGKRIIYQFPGISEIETILAHASESNNDAGYSGVPIILRANESGSLEIVGSP